MTTTTLYRGDGHDGYEAGTWGYTIQATDTPGEPIWCDGGWPSREAARDAMRRRLSAIRQQGFDDCE